MTREKIRNMLAMLPILQAYADGATVQVNVGDRRSSIPQWQDVSNPEFNGSPSDYRIKPSPVVRWSIMRKSGLMCALYDSEEKAAESLKWCQESSREYKEARIVKFVEEMK